MCASDRRPIHRRLTRLTSMALVAVLACAHLTAHAEGDREQEQVKRLKLQLRQIQQERDTAVQDAQNQAATEKAAMSETLKSAKGDADVQRRAASAASRRAEALSTELTELKKAQEEAQSQIAQLKTALEDAKARMQAEQTHHAEAAANWQSRYKTLDDQHEECRTQNAQLYEIGTDLLARYEHKGFAEVLGGKEPFIQTARVTLENVKMQYQDKLDAARLKVVSAP